MGKRRILHPEAKAALVVAMAAERGRVDAVGWRPSYGYLLTCRRPDGRRTFLRADTYAEAVELRERERMKSDWPAGSDFWLRMRTAEDEEQRLVRRAARRAASDGGDAYVVGSSA